MAMKNKLLSLGLCAALLFTLLPLYALADDEEAVQESGMTETYCVSEEEEEIFSTEEEQMSIQDSDANEIVPAGDERGVSDESQDVNEPAENEDGADAITQLADGEPVALDLDTYEPIQIVLGQGYPVGPYEGVLYSYTPSVTGFYKFSALFNNTHFSLYDEYGSLYYSGYHYMTFLLDAGYTYYWMVDNNYSDTDTLTLSKVDGLRNFSKTADADTANSGDEIGFSMTAQVIALTTDTGSFSGGGGSFFSVNQESEIMPLTEVGESGSRVYPCYLTFHDLLDDELILDEESITIIYHRNQLDGASGEAKDIALPDNLDLYSIITDPSDDCSYEVQVDPDAMSQTQIESTYEAYLNDWDELEYSYFELTYSAKLSEEVKPGIYYNTGSATADFYYTYGQIDESSVRTVTPPTDSYAFTESSEKVVTPITTYGIEVYKYDSQTQEVLSDAGFELTDQDGQVVETLTTDGNGFASCGTYADGREFILTETVTPEGYIMKEDSVGIRISEETTTDFIYTVRVENEPEDGEKPDDGKPDDGEPDDGKPDSEKPDDEKPDNEHPEVMGGNVGSPKTGDTNHMGLWLVLFIASAVCGSAVIYIRRKI